MVTGVNAASKQILQSVPPMPQRTEPLRCLPRRSCREGGCEALRAGSRGFVAPQGDGNMDDLARSPRWCALAVVAGVVDASMDHRYRLQPITGHRSLFTVSNPHGLGSGVGRGLGVGPDRGVGVGLGVAVGVALGVVVAVAVGVAVAVLAVAV